SFFSGPANTRSIASLISSIEISVKFRRAAKIAAAIDEEVRKLVDTAYLRAKEVLLDNRKVLDEIAQMLIEKETVDAEELQEILGNNDVKMAAFA
ncbi:hypothetical protein MEN41_17725, partial [Dolichospermum sp. ST_con]|nr:hypothetical protein [Dolichospermum sp. ST_con]